MDPEKIMEQAMAEYKKAMETTLQEALAQQQRMGEEMGFETTPEDRQELIDDYARQMEQYEAMMRRQMEVQSAMMGDGDLGGMAQMAAQMAGMMAQLQEEDDDEDELDEEALAAFLEENAVPPECQKYMPIGALLIGTHGEPYQTLRLVQDEEYTAAVLENGWGIESREDGLEMLESLLGGRHANAFAEEFAKAKAGDFEEMDEEDAEDYQAGVEAITEVLELPGALVERCDTLYAWDLERIGYLVRLFVNMGYLAEEEAWGWMQEAAAKIKETFSTWEEYMVSLLLGRGFAMGLHQEPYAVALDLLTDSRPFLDANPISALA